MSLSKMSFLLKLGLWASFASLIQSTMIREQFWTVQIWVFVEAPLYGTKFKTNKLIRLRLSLVVSKLSLSTSIYSNVAKILRTFHLICIPQSTDNDNYKRSPLWPRIVEAIVPPNICLQKSLHAYLRNFGNHPEHVFLLLVINAINPRKRIWNQK